MRPLLDVRWPWMKVISKVSDQPVALQMGVQNRARGVNALIPPLQSHYWRTERATKLEPRSQQDSNFFDVLMYEIQWSRSYIPEYIYKDWSTAKQIYIEHFWNVDPVF